MEVNTSFIPRPGKRYPPRPLGQGGYLFPGRGIKLVFTNIGSDNIFILHPFIYLFIYFIVQIWKLWTQNFKNDMFLVFTRWIPLCFGIHQVNTTDNLFFIG